MKRPSVRAAFLFVAIAFLATAATQARDLTFEERVAAQEAIERVYYSHQIGATKPFEEAVPHALLASKVRTYLKQSVALETFWKTPVTRDALHKELERMVAHTRMPERLRQLYAVLGNDPFLIQETLARPALADRLTRNFFAYDATIHAEMRQEAEALRKDLVEGRLDPRSEHAGRTAVELVRVEAGQATAGFNERERAPASGIGHASRLEVEPDAFDRYRSRLPAKVGEIGPIDEERTAFVTRVILSISQDEMEVATFVVPKLSWDAWWTSVEGRLEEASVHAVASLDVPIPIVPADRSEPFSEATCLTDDTWDNGALDGDDVPEPRSSRAVWTGSLMLVWGGEAGYDKAALNTGGRYDPATDSWTPISTTNAPPGRSHHTALWTGGLMVVWGGHDTSVLLNSGGRYDPATDTWNPTSMTNAPSGRHDHTAVWTGSLMIVWGDGAFHVNTGGRYDPATDTWTSTSTINAPTGRGSHTAIWTGSLMVVWGGRDSFSFFNSGGRYDPATDSWSPTSTANAPLGREAHATVWTGSFMLVWGGRDSDGSQLNTGGRYYPSIDTWGSMTTIGAPSARSSHSAIWTGNLMIVWGGDTNYTAPYFLNTGGRYDPATDRWTPTSTTSAPSGRSSHIAIWTGSLMIVWGGSDGSYRDTGGRYDPTTDNWTPTATNSNPSGRGGHTAVWTGSLMIVWGGAYSTFQYYFLNTGGRYDPATDTWTPTSTTTAPRTRTGHTAVWTGSVMIVWGGSTDGGQFGTYLADGARYDPIADTWSPISYYGPSARVGHTAVWTGSRMIVWGGWDFLGYFNTGGRYNPVSDTWTPTSTTNAPSARGFHTAIWTGSLMIVWGGNLGGFIYNTGGRYDPVNDTWSPTSTAGVPFGSGVHTAAWTGSLMIAWGGIRNLFTGGRYDPATDVWTPISTTNAPSGRGLHTAVWTGNRMVIWGGYDGLVYVGDGAQYDPASDAWTPISMTNAPSRRGGHTAVWTGSLMVVWGGYDGSHLNTGGRYALGHAVDDDGDSFSECQGDCNDGNAAVYPGAPEICDGLDNSCDGAADEGNPGGDLPCVTGLPGVCAAGLTQCRIGRIACDALSAPAAEICDSLDNDCDGAIDENFPDTEKDGVPDCRDDCQVIWNPDQADGNSDGIGDVCEAGALFADANLSQSGFSTNRVDGRDLGVFAGAFGSCPGDADYSAVANLDRIPASAGPPGACVDMTDFHLFMVQFGKVQ